MMSVAEYFTQAQKQVEQNQWQEARGSLRKVIELEPNRWDAYFNLGQISRKLQQYEEAIEAYQNAIAINQDYSLTYNNLGIIFLHLKQTREAINLFSQAIELEGNNPWFYHNLAQAFVQQGNEAKALDFFKKAIQLEPNSPDLQVQLGECLKRQGLIQEAVNCFCQTIKVNPNYFPAYKALRATEIKSDWLEKLVTFYRELLEKSHDLVPALINLAELFSQQNKFRKAIDCYRQVIITTPKDNIFHKQAIREYQNKLKSLSDQQPKLYYRWGQLLQSQGYFTEALTAYQEAIKIDPKFNLAYIAIQYTTIPKAKLEPLTKFYQQIIKVCSYPLAWGNLGDALTEQGKIKEAITCYQKSSYQQTITKYPHLEKLNWPEKKEQAPDFLIIGASKCGTTSLHRTLSHHPQILFSHKKELNFFNYHYFNLGIDWYLSHFPTITDHDNFLTGEATPNYLRFPIVAERIKQYCPHVKLIILLRNPLDRTVSWYYQKKRLGFTNNDLEEAITQEIKLLETLNETKHINFGFQNLDNIISSLYYYQIKAWIKYFPRQQFLILKSEDFFEHPNMVMKQVFQFLELPDVINQNYQKLNTGSYPPLNKDMKQKLNEFFYPHNKKLEEYLQMEFNW